MEYQAYKRQVKLLLDVLPEVDKEKCFALHGGTAINLFIRDMPRLSVDIDLTYVPVENRDTSLNKITEALARIKKSIEHVIPGVTVVHKVQQAKLQVSSPDASIKVEVNTIKRGVFGPLVQLPLCNRAQEEFEVFCAINVVSFGELYGGKICAALDRQHPRDLFDVRDLLDNEGFTEEVKTGFLFCLLGSVRPFNEMLHPNFQDQTLALANQFDGMATKPFTYQNYEQTRAELVATVQANLTENDKDFLLSVKNITPDWTTYNFEQFPSVKWKLQNLKSLLDQNPEKHAELYGTLKGKLGR